MTKFFVSPIASFCGILDSVDASEREAAVTDRLFENVLLRIKHAVSL
jgi:hypothetical protein